MTVFHIFLLRAVPKNIVPGFISHRPLYIVGRGRGVGGIVILGGGNNFYLEGGGVKIVNNPTWRYGGGSEIIVWAQIKFHSIHINLRTKSSVFNSSTVESNDQICFIPVLLCAFYDSLYIHYSVTHFTNTVSTCSHQNHGKYNMYVYHSSLCENPQAPLGGQTQISWMDHTDRCSQGGTPTGVSHR